MHLLGLRLAEGLEAGAMHRELRRRRQVVLAEGAGAHLPPGCQHEQSGKATKGFRL